MKIQFFHLRFYITFRFNDEVFLIHFILLLIFLNLFFHRLKIIKKNSKLNYPKKSISKYIEFILKYQMIKTLQP